MGHISTSSYHPTDRRNCWRSCSVNNPAVQKLNLEGILTMEVCPRKNLLFGANQPSHSPISEELQVPTYFFGLQHSLDPVLKRN